MFGGGIFTTMFKHSKINNAQRSIEHAKRAIRHLKNELEDIDRLIDVDLKTGDFLSFADFFFDGLVADWLMQSRISDARRQIERAIEDIEDIKDELVNL